MSRVENVLNRLHIAFRKQGPELFAKCMNPAHDDSSPSWRIRDDGGPKTGQFNCFACGFTGDLYTLVQTVNQCTFPEAKAFLAGDAEATLREVDEVQVKVRGRLKFSFPDGVEPVKPLNQWDSSARRYAEKRHLFAEQIAMWGITYALKGRLGGRLIVPYQNLRGDLLGYTARTYYDVKPRYIEPEPSRDGSSLAALFGEYGWPPAGVARSELWVTEGAFNALAIQRAMGDVYVAALAGSQIRVQHAPKLASWKRIFIVSDPDAAGDKLAAQITEFAQRYGIETHRVNLPGVDADDLAQEELNAICFREFVKVDR
jgi:DNA primase